MKSSVQMAGRKVNCHMYSDEMAYSNIVNVEEIHCTAQFMFTIRMYIHHLKVDPPQKNALKLLQGFVQLKQEIGGTNK